MIEDTFVTDERIVTTYNLLPTLYCRNCSMIVFFCYSWLVLFYCLSFVLLLLILVSRLFRSRIMSCYAEAAEKKYIVNLEKIQVA